MSELAKRAVACKHWRLMPGMLTEHGNRYVRAAGVSSLRSVLPDLTDPATLGCLLALVREAWGDPTITTTATREECGIQWELECAAPNDMVKALWCYFDTEAEALVAALEAAP